MLVRSYLRDWKTSYLLPCHFIYFVLFCSETHSQWRQRAGASPRRCPVTLVLYDLSVLLWYCMTSVCSGPLPVISCSVVKLASPLCASVRQTTLFCASCANHSPRCLQDLFCVVTNHKVLGVWLCVCMVVIRLIKLFLSTSACFGCCFWSQIFHALRNKEKLLYYTCGGAITA